ncbi:hypothetical protein ATO10_08127 [Actibacterium atlanticum]|uniref:Uncharacterized protein n=1 Tax=Actibacterium atlanticum TaxID=1461693 RepID=A0A058ZMC2_9RHOB|nr:hypothetical protein [Actibacterium atlanticum]KCV82342.1 hypothetical protein ATO10_08127 [Actibacterium atlanticum]
MTFHKKAQADKPAPLLILARLLAQVLVHLSLFAQPGHSKCPDCARNLDAWGWFGQKGTRTSFSGYTTISVDSACGAIRESVGLRPAMRETEFGLLSSLKGIQANER